MSTERETKEFKTVGGHDIVTYAYLTGREYNQIEAVYLGSVKVGSSNGRDMHMESIATVEQDANRKMLELMLISIDGDTENPAEKVLDLPAPDYLEIVDYLATLSGKKKTVE